MSSTLYFSCLSSSRPLASHSTPHAAFLFFPALYSHSKASATFRMLLLRLRRSFSLSLYSSNTVACRLLKEHSVEGKPYSYLDGHEPEKRRTDGRTEDVSLFSDPISAVPCHRTITSGANRGKERDSFDHRRHAPLGSAGEEKANTVPTYRSPRKENGCQDIDSYRVSLRRTGKRFCFEYLRTRNIRVFLSSRTNTIQPRHSNIVRCDKTAASRGFSSICVSLYLTLAFSLPSGQSR